MARSFAIVGLGEASLREGSERAVPDGLAALVCLAAKQLGDRGMLVSRIGQDARGDELFTLLQDAEIDVRALQRDPDLPTACVMERSDGSRIERYAHETAAFDNLQWDYDFEDAAAVTDGVVFGLLARRSGQTRSEEDRFLDRCPGALRVADLTNRIGDDVDRGAAISAIERAEIVAMDDLASRALSHATPNDLPAVVQSLARSNPAKMVILTRSADNRRSVIAANADRATAESALPDSQDAWFGFVTALLHHLIRGAAIDESVRTAIQFAQSSMIA